ncbi:hypothetical protein C175_00145 [Bacillus cereus]|nr:hypothetical protein C175_00145 [Bacillus cereus]
MSGVSRCCLACDYQIKTYQSPEDEYQEVTVCPKCNGAFVDVFKLEMYKQSDSVKVNEEPLLTVTLTDIDAKPIVHYKGKQIDRKLRVAFDWESQSIDKINRTYIHIEHVPSDNKRFNTEVIQHNHPIAEGVSTSKVFADGEEVVKLVCKDCGISITGKRVSLEGKGCIHSVTHNTTLVLLNKE